MTDVISSPAIAASLLSISGCFFILFYFRNGDGVQHLHAPVNLPTKDRYVYPVVCLLHVMFQASCN